MNDHTGKIIEFIDGGRMRLALVTRQSGEKLQVNDTNGKQRRVPVKHVVIAHSAPMEASEFRTRGAALDARIEAVRDEVDTELLWEDVNENAGGLELENLARKYFGSVGTVELSALFRAVLGDTIRFSIRGRMITPLPPDQVASRFTALRARQERQALRARVINWIDGCLTAGHEKPEVPEEMSPILERIEGYLVHRRGDDIRDWLTAARPGRPTEQTAFDLLVETGRLPADADARLAIAGVREAFDEGALEDARELNPYVEDPDRTDFTGLVAFSIDDEDTREIDDALTVEHLGDTLRVGIHIADVAAFVQRDSAQDHDASRRGATLYLPHLRVPMLPGRLSFDLASLVRGELRPCMSVVVDFGADGAIDDWTIARGQLRVEHRLTYVEADRILDSAGDDSSSDGGNTLCTALESLNSIAVGLERARRERDAITVRRPELKLAVEDGVISVGIIDGDSASRRIVAEMMILANHLAARYASAHDLPIIFRAQDPPSEPVQQPEVYDPVAADRLFRSMNRSKLSLEVQPHAGLGLDAYTQLTSPLRRFQDLVIQRQFAAHLDAAPLPYEHQELLEVLGSADAVESDNRALERETTREYVLRYVGEHAADLGGSATILGKLTGGYLVELADLPIRGKLLSSAILEPGDIVEIRIGGVQPERGNLLLEEA